MSEKGGRLSRLWQPLKVADGKIELKHRIILAPLTRNRGAALSEGTPNEPNRIWIPDDVIAKYYRQRTTPGGLLITEGIHPSLEGGGTPGVPGLFHPDQVAGWKKVTSSVHEAGGYIYAQIWHPGRATMPQMTGMPTVSASATPFQTDDMYRYYPARKKDHPPIELSVEHIKRVINDFVVAAQSAMEAGFDGVEIHGANGYLPEQFLDNTINRRTDMYGGSPENRCRFILELISALACAIGPSNLAIRLSPFGLFNETFGDQRIDTFTYLCREIKRQWQLSYIHFIEPRFEQILSLDSKAEFLRAWGLEDVTLDVFREIMGDTPFFSAGGWNAGNCWGVLETGQYDALAFGRWFLANPDFVERLRIGAKMNPYDRNTFYWPCPVREVGYTDYPTLEELMTRETSRGAKDEG